MYITRQRRKENERGIQRTKKTETRRVVNMKRMTGIRKESNEKEKREEKKT